MAYLFRRPTDLIHFEKLKSHATPRDNPGLDWLTKMYSSNVIEILAREYVQLMQNIRMRLVPLCEEQNLTEPYKIYLQIFNSFFPLIDRSFIQFFYHSTVLSLIQSFINLIIPLFNCSFIRLFFHTIFHSADCFFIQLFPHSSNCSFVQWLLHSFT